jgi:hypothetical protein
MSELTTWRKELEAAMKAEDDTTAIVAVAPSEAVLDVEFDGGYGGSRGDEVLVWTEARVYFPVVYDGAEWISSAPRNPQPEGQGHVGGE